MKYRRKSRQGNIKQLSVQFCFKSLLVSNSLSIIGASFLLFSTLIHEIDQIIALIVVI